MNAALELRLWVAQRIAAAVLALFVIVHLITMVVVIDGGLSAAEILSRTRGHLGWAVFYALFVYAAAVHAGVGLRTIVMETYGCAPRVADRLGVLFYAGSLWLGWRAVLAVFV